MRAAPPVAGPSGSTAVIVNKGHRPSPMRMSSRSAKPPIGSSGSLVRKGILDPNRKVRVGLVGAGYVSTYHARALGSLPFVEIAGIADPDQSRAEALAERFQIPKVYA